ncbi:dTDP-4-dehydrorhamnose reductase [Oxalobacter sp. OttesenSCG-928-P03]|nr:dTDP-4-dehydrorhamnose reductase [Oxalobacter sp. OttesenSCG-928-P03]
MKILLFGKSGQIGCELLRTLPPLGQIIAPDRREADLENRDVLHKIITELAPDVIVNAAAYTAVDKAESDEARAFRINAEAVDILASYARYSGALLVHYSTDYVFDGQKVAPYIETDRPHPLNVYGRSKLAGEQALQQAGCHHFIFRTSWVFSSYGQNFVKTIWELGKERDALNVVADQVGTPTSAELVADVTALSIAAFYRDLLPEGIHHLAASGEASWYALACHVIQKAREKGFSMKMDAANINPIPAEAYPLPAARPGNSRLDNTALSEKLGFLLPEWQVHVDRAVDQLILAG